MKKHLLRSGALLGIACLIMLILTTSATAHFSANQANSALLAPDNLLIPEGDFEEDPPQIWVEQDSTNCTPWILNDDDYEHLPEAYSGNRIFWGGGACGNANSNSVHQVITVDENKTVISFWYYSDRTNLDTLVTDDFGYVEVDTDRIWELPLTLANNTNEWTNVTLDISAYLNNTVTLKFGAENGVRTGIGNIYFDFIEYVEVVPGEPDIELTKSPESQTVSAGGTAEFEITVENTGNVTLFDIVVEDPMAPESCGFEVEQLLVGEQTVPHECEIAGVQESFTNTATVTANDGSGTTVDDSATATVTVSNPAIEIIITPDTQSIPNDGTASFSMEVTNIGSETLTNTEIVSDSVGDCDKNLGQLVPEQKKIRTCEATNVTQSFLNTVTVTAQDGGTIVSDTDSAFVDVIDTDISIFIDSTMPTALKNGRVEFTVFVFNLGDTDFNNIQITDALAPDCDETIAFLEAGDNTSYPCQSEPVTAAFTNEIVATVAGGSDADVIQVDMLDMRLTATAENTMLPAQGGDVKVNLAIRNTGSKAIDLTTLRAGLINNQTDPKPLVIKNSSCETPTELAASANYTCSFDVEVAESPGSYQIGLFGEAMYEGEIAVSDMDNVSITIDEPAIKTIMLPLLVNQYTYSEENDTCGYAFPIGVNRDYQFLPDDQDDWYEFTTTVTANLVVELTDFTPINGQILLYSGNCNTATFLQNNGDFSATKIVDLGQQPAGKYLIWIITDGPTSTTQPYNLIVRQQ